MYAVFAALLLVSSAAGQAGPGFNVSEYDVDTDGKLSPKEFVKVSPHLLLSHHERC